MAYWTKEKIAEWIAKNTLERSNYSDIGEYQQVLSNGIIQGGTTNNQNIIIYKSDVLSLAGLDTQDFNELMSDSTFGSLQQFLSNYDGQNNQFETLITGSLISLSEPDNVSQFVGLQSGSIQIDPDKLNETLDTKITELLPFQTNRQDLINNFFSQYNLLKPSSEPPYCIDGEGNYTLDYGPILDDGSGVTICGNSIIYDSWASENNISVIQDNGGDDKNAPITREIDEENVANENQSLAWLVNDASRYLRDMELLLPQTMNDNRPEYSNQSEGYLEIRNLNQSIIIKRGEHESPTSARGIGDTIILGSSVEGGTFSDCASAGEFWLDLYPLAGGSFECGIEIPEFLINGFTITQWVKFKDKVNSGTLFNFGNPLRSNNPFGIRLETFTIRRDSVDDIGQSELVDGHIPFSNNNYERFVNLIVREGDGSLRDSNFGNNLNPKFDTISNNSTATDVDRNFYTNYTRVPIDFDEWYFIVARYNPNIDEDYSPSNITDMENNHHYWLNNLTDDSTPIMTHNSGLGNRCKVEIISKSDLLRARGFKPVK